MYLTKHLSLKGYTIVFTLNWHRYIFLTGIIGLATGMLFGTVPTSFPQFILAANWLLEGEFGIKWSRLKSNKIFWLLVSFYLLHVIGIIYTSNLQSGLNELRNKLPLLILPLMLFSTRILTTREFKTIMLFFFSGVIISSFCCYGVALGYSKKIIVDIRQASVFMSHIRFSLFIAFAIAGLIYYAFLEKNRILKSVCIISACWLLCFMYSMEMATGFICLFIVSCLIGVFYSIIHFNKSISVSIILLLFAGSVFLFNTARSGLNMYKPSDLPIGNSFLKITANGRPYLQDTVFKLAENGNLIAININDYELEKEWNHKSTIPYAGKDKKNNTLRFTILRYLSSKGFTKDSVGINKLSASDISNIEKGFSNYKYTSHTGLLSRWHELIWEYTKYRRGENPSGHTLMMRLEFWKTACYIIKQHPFFGVGTGDIQTSFNSAYMETSSKLTSEWRLRCHNQYLAVGVAFGITGLLFFLFYLFYPALLFQKKFHSLYWPFFLIALLSFFTEDTLETQSGVTFFIFFQTLFLWLASYKEPDKRVAKDVLPKK